MATVRFPDPFSATLLESPPLVVTSEQDSYIKKILDKACSDSRFADKAYLAIKRVLTSGPVVPPVVTSLNPSSVMLGEPSFPIHVIGTGFTPESKIIFNGFEEPTTLVSPTEVTTGINMDVWAAPAAVPVSVQNGSVVSDSQTFTFNSPATALSTSKFPAKQELKDKQVESSHVVERRGEK